MERASTDDKNTLETEITYIQPFTQAVLSQAYSSKDETQNWLLDSNEPIQEVIQNNVGDAMKNCNNQPIILSNATYLAPLSVIIGEVQNICQSADSIQQPTRKEALVYICQEDNKEQLQERKLNVLRGHTFLLCDNNTIIPCAQHMDIKSVCQSANIEDLERNSTYCKSEIQNEEIFGSSSDEENMKCKKELQMDTEEYLLRKFGYKAASQNQNKDLKPDIKNPKEHGDIELHYKLTGIFPNTSEQYSILMLKEVYGNLIDIKKIMIQSETSVKVKILGRYSQNQIKCEQRLQSITHRLIEEQIHIIESFKESSQAHIEMLINQKNVVEQENVFLLKKLEELHMLRQSHDSETHNPNKNSVLLENNEKLRNRLTFAQHSIHEQQTVHQEMLQQLEQYANEMHKQKLEIETQKMLQNRSENDFKIEKSYLCNELEKYKKCTQNGRDIACIIVEDIKKFQNSFEKSERRVCMNYEKLKVEDTSIVNVLSMCHSLINDLSLEVVNAHQELTAKDKKICTVKESNEQMQNVLNELETEYNLLQQQYEHVVSEKNNIEKQLIKNTQEISDLKDQISKYEQNKTLLETEINRLQENKTAAKEQEVLKLQLEKCVVELKKDKENMVQKILAYEKTDKAMEVDLMKMTALLEMYETQNKELIKAKHDLEKQMENIKVSYINLQTIPQHYEQLEKNYHKEIAEKDIINQQLKSMQLQISEYCHATSTNNKRMENLESEYKTISKENLEMKWELNNLKNINQRLEHDNSDMLHRLEEESDRHICKINESHSRLQELHNQIKTQEKEIAELKNMFLIQTETIYSLHQECEEKQNVIINLEEKCRDLNILHQKDEHEISILNNKTKELENQITAVGSSNKVILNSMRDEFEALETTLKITQDGLNNSVTKLQEKETNLISFQENLQTAEHRLVEKEYQIADYLRTIKMLQNKLQDIQDMKNKYAEMQDILEIHESTIEERNTLKEDVTTLQIKIVTLQADFEQLQNKNNTLIKYCTLQKEHIKGMKAQITKLQEYISKADIRNREDIEIDLHQVTYDLNLHNSKSADLEYEIQEYKFIIDEKQNGNEEKCRLQSQLMLLHELHKRNSNDLTQARRTIEMQEDKIIELMNQINEGDNEKIQNKRELGIMAKQHELLLAEIKTLQDRVKEENQNCLSLTEEYQKEMSKQEANFLKNVQELNNRIETLEEEIKGANSEKESLMQALEKKKKEESLLKTKSEKMESRLSDYGQTLSHLVQENRKNSKENSYCLEDFKHMENNELKQFVKELMKSQECLLRHKKDLSFKLLKALKIIHQTKLKYKIANEKIQELSSQSISLRNQKILKEEVLNSISEIGELNGKVKQKISESEKQLSVHKLQKYISRLEHQVDELQLQSLKAKQKAHKKNFKIKALLLVKEDIILQGKEQINLLQEKTNRLCARLAEVQSKMLQQNQEQRKLKFDMVTLQAEKRELSLQLKVTEGNLNEEKQGRIHLQGTYHKLLQKMNNDLK